MGNILLGDKPHHCPSRPRQQLRRCL